MPQEVDCSVSAVKFWHSGSDLFEYSLVIPFDTPSDLPEGVYNLSFDGRTMLHSTMARHGSLCELEGRSGLPFASPAAWNAEHGGPAF